MTLSSLENLRKLAAAKGGDLREMARQLDCEPENFYIGTDLSGVELRGQDLRGIRLDGTNLQRAIFDLTTTFDPDIDAALRDIAKKRYLQVSTDLFRFVEKFFSKDRFVSKGWFIKRIVPLGAREIAERFDAWAHLIDQSPELSGFFHVNDRARVELTLNVYDYIEGQKLGKRYGGYGSALTALIVVALLSISEIDPSTEDLPVKKVNVLKRYLSDGRLYVNFLTRNNNP